MSTTKDDSSASISKDEILISKHYVLSKHYMIGQVLNKVNQEYDLANMTLRQICCRSAQLIDACTIHKFGFPPNQLQKCFYCKQPIVTDIPSSVCSKNVCCLLSVGISKEDVLLKTYQTCLSCNEFYRDYDDNPCERCMEEQRISRCFELDEYIERFTFQIFRQKWRYRARKSFKHLQTKVKKTLYFSRPCYLCHKFYCAHRISIVFPECNYDHFVKSLDK